MTSNLILPYSGGLWTPDTVMDRYGNELSLTASALLKFYDEINGGRGQSLVVPVEQMLRTLRMANTAECRNELKRLVNEVGLRQQIGTRMEHGVVSVWFSPEVERLTQTYKRLPGGLTS